MLVECYLKFSMMLLKHLSNLSNTCCEQALKEREIRTQTTNSSATVLDELSLSFGLFPFYQGLP